MESNENQNALEIDYFVNKKVASLYVCQICLQVPNPLTAVEHADCGKLFCLPCISNWIRSSRQCTNCKGPFLNSSPNLSITLKRLILSILVLCPNTPSSDAKCPWEGEWEELQQHERECPYALIPCLYNCGKEIMRRDMGQHTKVDCPNKLVPCNFCKKNVNLNLLKEHEYNCEFNMEAVINCRYAAAGCEARFKRRDRAVHEQEAAGKHLKIAAEYSKVLQNRLTLMEEEKKARSGAPMCKNEHKLIFMTEFEGGSSYICDLCRVSFIPYKAGTWKCAPCDFDMCNGCYYNKFIKSKF